MENAGNGILKLVNFKIFWGSMPPDPPRGSCLRHSRFQGRLLNFPSHLLQNLLKALKVLLNSNIFSLQLPTGSKHVWWFLSQNFEFYLPGKTHIVIKTGINFDQKPIRVETCETAPCVLGNKLLNIQFAKYHIWNNKSGGFPNLVLSTETFNQSVHTEYLEAVNACYTFQPLSVSVSTHDRDVYSQFDITNCFTMQNFFENRNAKRFVR